MLKKTVSYQDFDDNPQTETLYFNLSKTELIELEQGYGGDGFAKHLQAEVKTGDGKRIMAAFKEILSAAYGVRSEDGRRFHKSKEQTDDFLSSPAYDALFYELATNPTAAAEFVTGVMPQDIMAQVTNNQAAQDASATASVATAVPVPPVTTQPVASTIAAQVPVGPSAPAPGPSAVTETGTVPQAFRKNRPGRVHRPQPPSVTTAESVEDVNLANATPEQLQAALARLQSPPANS